MSAIKSVAEVVSSAVSVAEKMIHWELLLIQQTLERVILKEALENASLTSNIERACHLLALNSSLLS